MKAHFFTHSLVTGIIAIFAYGITLDPLSAWAGALFYTGREFTQWEIGKKFDIPMYDRFDWQGFISPVLTSYIFATWIF